ncbi:hypothetical protein IV487_00065 [Enterococcus saccharolyticus]|uniref:hypothetical protein n=1 Tax=Enterococcus saccharolyticus TaxID=41997 RepID=UPI001E50C507|nr:hypothetical protein [Enterococcus saccharolyticus]MCD5000868.1 hypothetical protein [Enterococcus saccharolyticus]
MSTEAKDETTKVLSYVGDLYMEKIIFLRQVVEVNEAGNNQNYHELFKDLVDK